MKKILIAGSLNMDLTVDVNRFPRTGESVYGDHLRFSNGGKGANQAAAVGKLGGQAVMIGSVGADAFGRRQIEALKAAGVNTDHIQTADEATGTALIYVNQSGDNSIVYAPGANEKTDAAYVEKNICLIDQADIVLTQMEIPEDAVMLFLKTAKHAGKITCLNPAPAPDRMPEEILRNLDYITPNETELEKLTGLPCGTQEEIRAASEKLLLKGVRKVLVTLGDRGCMLTGSEGSRYFPIAKRKAVDPTGAGDIFNGAFLTGLAEGKSEEESILFANTAAGLSVTRRGAQDSVPTRAEVDAALG